MLQKPSYVILIPARYSSGKFLEIGIKVKMLRMSDSSVFVDIPNDIKEVEKILRK